jgi:hypothetical protein
MRSFIIPGLARPISTIALGTGGFGSAIPAVRDADLSKDEIAELKRIIADKESER